MVQAVTCVVVRKESKRDKVKFSSLQIFKENLVQQVKTEAQINVMCGHHPFLVRGPFRWQNKRNLFIGTYVSCSTYIFFLSVRTMRGSFSKPFFLFASKAKLHSHFALPGDREKSQVFRFFLQGCLSIRHKADSVMRRSWLNFFLSRIATTCFRLLLVWTRNCFCDWSFSFLRSYRLYWRRRSAAALARVWEFWWRVDKNLCGRSGPNTR